MKRRMLKVREVKRLCPLMPEEILQHAWRIEEEISSGAFGTVYKALDVVRRNFVAIKASKRQEDRERSHLRWEAKVYERFKGSRHCPRLIACYLDDEPQYLVLELLGPSLNYLVKRLRDRILPKGIAAAVSRQCLNAVNDLHNACFVHRDIKPSNFAIGLGNNRRTIYMIDFGLCRKYCHKKERPFSERNRVGFRGTVRYASPRAHLKKDLCRADDLVSLFYMTYELLVGQLPWKCKSDTDVILNMKMRQSLQIMARGLDVNFQLFAEHIESLSYASQPNYEMIDSLLANVMRAENVDENTPFGWEHIARREEERINKRKSVHEAMDEVHAGKVQARNEEMVKSK